MSDRLQQAIAAIQAGDKATARQLLAEILKSDPDHEKAWLWMSSAVEYDKSRQRCLEYVLEINPTNEVARRELAALQAKLAGSLEIGALSNPVGTPLPSCIAKPMPSIRSGHARGERERGIYLSLLLAVVMSLSLFLSVTSTVFSGWLVMTLLGLVHFVLAVIVWVRQKWGDVYGIAFFALSLIIGLMNFYVILTSAIFVFALGLWNWQKWGAYGLCVSFALSLLLGVTGNLYLLLGSVILGVPLLVLIGPKWHLLK